MPIGEPFTDARGTITDLLGEVDSVTEIRSVKGAIRGNHVHHHTTQWTYIVSGAIFIVTPKDPSSLGCGTKGFINYPGNLWEDKPGVPHAWQALEDTVCLVFTKGPRSGADYESDTERLKVPLIEP